MNLANEINNKERILSIREVEENGFDGFKILTTEQEIFLGIDNFQSWCEDWGYFVTEDKDKFDDYKGAYLIDIKITDTELKSVDRDRVSGKFSDIIQDDGKIYTTYEGSTMFVDIVTNKGTLQFCAYNEHNGYYGHDVVIRSKQLQREICL